VPVADRNYTVEVLSLLARADEVIESRSRRAFVGCASRRVLHIVVVKIAFAGRNLVALAVLPVGALGRSLERSRRGGRRGTFGAGDYRAGWYLRDDDAIELDDPMGWEPLSQ
jgi:hypothetical protein